MTEKREYIKLNVDGQWCVMTPLDACAELQACDNPSEYTIESVWLTKEEFEAMPEFDGF